MQTLDPNFIRRIAASYGQPAAKVDPPQTGYRNASYRLTLENNLSANLMIYKREPGILPRVQVANALGRHLHQAGFPIRYPLDPRIVVITSPAGISYAGLYNYLSGQTIPWEAYTRHHLKLMGMALSDLHTTLKTSKVSAPSIASEYQDIFRRMSTYFNDYDVQLAMSHKLGLSLDTHTLAKLIKLLDRSENFRGQQLLHMDFVRSNLLFGTTLDFPETPYRLGGVALTGIIDFEKASYGHPVFDIARTLAFLLVDCKYKSPRQIYRYFLRSGYMKRGKAPFRKEWLPMLERLIDLFLLYDFYKFLRHNPYESLGQNQHYTRTVNILLERGLLTRRPTSSKMVHSIVTDGV